MNKEIIAREKNITALPLKIKNAYDLTLFREASDSYAVEVFMELQFFFEDTPNLTWKPSEKASYVTRWTTEARSAWRRPAFHLLGDGKTVSLDFRFDTKVGGFMLDHWEIYVKKIPRGDFSVSYVNPRDRETFLDSEDLSAVYKQADIGCQQRGAVHEFGHMLGLRDEYHKASPHVKDHRSIMHSCERVKGRHLGQIHNWLQKALRENDIK